MLSALKEAHCVAAGAVECLALTALRLHHSCMKLVVDSVNRFYSADTRVLFADGKESYWRYPAFIP